MGEVVPFDTVLESLKPYFAGHDMIVVCVHECLVTPSAFGCDTEGLWIFMTTLSFFIKRGDRVEGRIPSIVLIFFRSLNPGLRKSMGALWLLNTFLFRRAYDRWRFEIGHRSVKVMLTSRSSRTRGWLVLIISYFWLMHAFTISSFWIRPHRENPIHNFIINRVSIGLEVLKVLELSFLSLFGLLMGHNKVLVPWLDIDDFLVGAVVAHRWRVSFVWEYSDPFLPRNILEVNSVVFCLKFDYSLQILLRGVFTFFDFPLKLFEVR